MFSPRLRAMGQGPGRLLPTAVLASAIVALLPPPAAGARAIGHGARQARLLAAAGEPFAASQQNVIVQQGDTLWGLCERYTGKGYVWPQIWALNPQLTNPHWLEPGGVVRFGTQSPAPAPASGAAVAAAEPVALVHAISPNEPLSPNDALRPAAAVPRPTLRCALWPRDAAHALPRVTALRADALLARKGDGLAVAAAAGHALEANALYVTLAGLGSVADLGGCTGGELLQVTGLVRGVVGGRAAEVVLERAFGEVEAGQRVAPLAAFRFDPAAVQAAPPGPFGSVLAVEMQALFAGSQKLVFVGAGSKAGLAPGMRLWLVDPAAQPSEPPLGELQVLQAQPNHSACALLRSRREVGRGDRVFGGPLPAAPFSH